MTASFFRQVLGKEKHTPDSMIVSRKSLRPTGDWANPDNVKTGFFRPDKSACLAAHTDQVEKCSSIMKAPTER